MDKCAEVCTFLWGFRSARRAALNEVYHHHHRHCNRHILFCFPRQLVFFQRTRRKAKADRNLKHFKGNLNKTTLNSDISITMN